MRELPMDLHTMLLLLPMSLWAQHRRDIMRHAPSTPFPVFWRMVQGGRPLYPLLPGGVRILVED